MKKLQNNTITKFQEYFDKGTTSENLAIFIRKHWNDYKDWSKNQTENPAMRKINLLNNWIIDNQ